MIEQPELHIHPALQVALGDLFIEQSASRQFIIETHSEHLILRILRRIRETTANELPPGAPRFDPTRLSVLYVEPSEDGTKVRRLHVDDTGEFTDRWPAGFFEERAEELF
jgi:predicted ATPase